MQFSAMICQLSSLTSSSLMVTHYNNQTKRQKNSEHCFALAVKHSQPPVAAQYFPVYDFCLCLCLDHMCPFEVCGYEMFNGKCMTFFPLRNVRWLRLGLWREEPSTPWVSVATIIQSEKCHGKGNFETFGMFGNSCSIWFQSDFFLKK